MNENELQEINVETIKHLDRIEKDKILSVRREWLKRQRLQDRKDLKKQQQRISYFFWTKKGLCPNCKEHEIIYKSKMCLKCYGRILKAHRTKHKRKTK